jgi:hypothetical protein
MLPPIVQREWLDGSGPKTMLTLGPKAVLTCSLIAPGWT